MDHSPVNNHLFEENYKNNHLKSLEVVLRAHSKYSSKNKKHTYIQENLVKHPKNSDSGAFESSPTMPLFFHQLHFGGNCSESFLPDRCSWENSGSSLPQLPVQGYSSFLDRAGPSSVSETVLGKHGREVYIPFLCPACSHKADTLCQAQQSKYTRPRSSMCQCTGIVQAPCWEEQPRRLWGHQPGEHFTP